MQTTIAAAFFGFALLAFINPLASWIAGMAIMLLFVGYLARIAYLNWRDKAQEGLRRERVKRAPIPFDSHLDDEFERRWRESRVRRKPEQ